MRSTILPLLGSLVIAALSACEAPAPRLDQQSSRAGASTTASLVDRIPSLVSPAGVGAVRVGSTLAQATSALHAPMPTSSIVCGYASPAGLPAGVRLLVLNDTVARIDVDSAGVRTTEHAGVGDTEARILTLYGARARVTPHKYTGPTGHYVTVGMPADSAARVVFETDGARVVRYRAGRLPAVELVEGCG